MMKRLLLITYLVLSPWVLYAAFEDIGTGARPTALGGAYVTLGDDTFSMFYNPAGLARLRHPEIVTEYSQLYPGLSDGSRIGHYMLGGSLPMKSAGTIALGWKQLNLSGLYSERTLALGYAQWLFQRLAVGAAIKQLHNAFEAPDSVVDDNGNIQNRNPSLFNEHGDSNSNYSFDLGLLYRFTDRQYVGYAIQDVNEPNIALDRSDQDTLARTHRWGWSYQSPRKLALGSAFSTRQCPCDKRDYLFAWGVEKGWSFKRMGDLTTRGSFSLGTREFRQLAMGFGYRWAVVQMDYAFIFNMGGLSIGDTAGIHRFSLNYKFNTKQAPAMTPVGVPIQDLPANILHSESLEGNAAFSLEQDTSIMIQQQP